MLRLTPGAKILMGLHGAVWLLSRPWQDQAYALGVMDPDAVLHGEIWRLLTYPFVTSLGGLLLALLGLLFFAPPVEERLGLNRLFALYIGSSLVSSVALALVSLVVNRPGGLMGPTAAQMALVAAWASLEPQGTVRLYFVLPIKAIWMLWLFVFLDVARMWEAQRFLWPVAAELLAAPVGYWAVDFFRGRLSLGDLNPVERFKNWRYRRKLLKFRVHDGGSSGGAGPWVQ